MIYPAPSYLSGQVTDVIERILLEIQKEYGDNTTAFQFDRQFKMLVRTWNTEYGEYGNTVFGLDTDNNRFPIFDPSQNGYDGIFGHIEQEDLTSTKNMDVSKDTKIIVAFQYEGDESESIEEGNSKFVQDYFGSFVIYKFADNKLEEIFSCECM
jgi:hypothetical protein